MLLWNYTRMLHAILNKSWKQHPTKEQLYAPLPPINKPFKYSEQNMQGTGGKVRMES